MWQPNEFSLIWMFNHSMSKTWSWDKLFTSWSKRWSWTENTAANAKGINHFQSTKTDEINTI